MQRGFGGQHQALRGSRKAGTRLLRLRRRQQLVQSRPQSSAALSTSAGTLQAARQRHLASSLKSVGKAAGKKRQSRSIDAWMPCGQWSGTQWRSRADLLEAGGTLGQYDHEKYEC